MSGKFAAKRLQGPRSGETFAPEPADPFWWEGTASYWELPFYAEMNLCCEGLLDNYGEMLAAREQLWAIREKLTDI